MAGIVLASLLPTLPQAPVDIEYMDKIEHGLAYAVAGTLGSFFFRKPDGEGRPGAAIRSVAFGMALGVAIELVQPFVGRSRELADGLADLAGLVVGAGIFLAVTKPRRRPVASSHLW